MAGDRYLSSDMYSSVTIGGRVGPWGNGKERKEEYGQLFRGRQCQQLRKKQKAHYISARAGFWQLRDDLSHRLATLGEL